MGSIIVCFAVLFTNFSLFVQCNIWSAVQKFQFNYDSVTLWRLHGLD